ncbi:polysaccharide deacetylase family protein [Shouchella patagoniensis]|uniref:polysaccharide deacetylase family protein n=1 Tax=Shouchella patagoniensis TaxID=228576 RepID=UPI000995C26C|nr:polysaccharide deacetylase family protein [Shouchella patagoniensis]
MKISAKNIMTVCTICVFASSCSYTYPEYSNALHRKAPAQHFSSQDFHNQTYTPESSMPKKAESNLESLDSKSIHSIYSKAETEERNIALSFNDGPDKLHTNAILDLLKEMNVKATFFVIGSKIENNETILKRIVAEGHMVGNHTFHHLDLTSLTTDEILQELDQTEKKIANTIGRKTKMVRVPYHLLNEQVVQVLHNEGYHIIGWSLDAMDGLSEYQLTAKHVVSEIKPGDIILHHDGIEQSNELLMQLPDEIKELKKRGYQFLTVPDLLKIKGLN